MPTISLCMIVKNEEDVLERCLSSIAGLADEIIIVDTGSTDATKDVARRFTDKVFDFTWIDDFAAARNFSFSKATMDYIMWLDADDVLLPDDAENLRRLKAEMDPKVDVVMMKYNTGFDSEGHVTLSYFRARLLKRSRNFTWFEPVHEYIQPSGCIINSDIAVTHKKTRPYVAGRNLRVFEKSLAEGQILSPRSLYYFARELRDAERTRDAIVYFNKFLDSAEGWVEDRIFACYDLSLCYLAVGDQQNRLKALLRSYELDTPRAEVCCQLGRHYFDAEQYEKAVFWYELATRLKKPVDSWGFMLYDCWGYLPNIQLCVCHHRLGHREQAILCNQKAAEYKPNDPAVLYNMKYFKDTEATTEGHPA